MSKSPLTNKRFKKIIALVSKEGCGELVIPVKELTKQIIDIYGADATATHEVKEGVPVVIVRDCNTIAAIKESEAKAAPLGSKLQN